MTALWILLRPRRHSGVMASLQIVASAIATLLSFAVATFAVRLWAVPDESGAYRVLAVALSGLLLVPLLTLGSAATRLTVRSRDERLASLRLLGASTRTVQAVSVVEATALQLFGVVAGVVLSLPVPLAVAHLPLANDTSVVETAWLPTPVTVALLLILVSLAPISAMMGLRQVVLSPLGVANRANAPRMSWVRLAIGAAALVTGILLTQFASPNWGITGIVIGFTIAVLIIMGVLGIVGPFAISLTARRRANTTSDAARLVAARRNLEDPKAAWRGVSAIALTSFILLPSGAMLGFLNAVERSDSVLTHQQIMLFADARTVLFILVAISYVLAACQIGVTQTAAIIENRELYIALDRIGMPRREMDLARKHQAVGPAIIAIVGSAAAAAALTLPLLLVATTNSPLFVATTLVFLACGVLLVRVGVAAARSTLSRVLAAPSRGE